MQPSRRIPQHKTGRESRASVCALFAIGFCLFILAGCGGPGRRPVVEGWRAISLADTRDVAVQPRRSYALDRLAEAASLNAVDQEGRGRVTPSSVWTTVIDCRDPRDPRIGSYRGGEPVYPASVIKLCYLVAAFDQNRVMGLVFDRAMRRDLHDMIVYSDNQATNRVLDRLSNTGFGPDLDGLAWESFTHKRGTPGRLMRDMGLPGLWPANKTFDSDIPLYGRDKQWLGTPAGDHYKNSNSMTTDDTARLLYLIWRRAVVDKSACEDMLDLMRRDGKRSKTYFSKIVPPGAILHSKGGSTDLERHDAGIFDLGDGKAIIIVSFTVNHGVTSGEYPQVIEHVGRTILDDLLGQPGELDRSSEGPPPSPSAASSTAGAQ